jgi:hypothetical protein
VSRTARAEKCCAVMDIGPRLEGRGVLAGEAESSRLGVANSKRVGRMLLRAVFCKDADAFSLSAIGHGGGGAILRCVNRVVCTRVLVHVRDVRRCTHEGTRLVW